MIRRKRALSKKKPIIYNTQSNLLFDNFLLQNELEPCEPKLMVKECRCGRFTFQTGCMRKNCPLCSERLNLRRAKSVFDRFQKYKRACRIKRVRYKFCYTDFTIPPALRQNFVNPKSWQKLRLKLWNLLRDKYGAIFGVEATHPIGDRNPEVFHPHLNFLWALGANFKYYIDVDELRDFLRAALRYSGIVDCWHQAGVDDAQLMGWAKYITRIFPEFSKWAGALRWYGAYPVLSKKEPCVCPNCKLPVMVIGYVSKHILKDYDDHGFALGRDPPWENDKYVTFFKKPNFE